VVVAAVMLWIMIVAWLVFVVPEFERIFADFKMRVPLGTDAIIACSRWCMKYPYVLPMPLAMIGVSTWLIRHRVRKRWLGGLWCLAMLVLPAGLAFLIWLLCYLPMERLLEGLAAPKG
jgi:type II secretory pathway component PulF